MRTHDIEQTTHPSRFCHLDAVPFCLPCLIRTSLTHSLLCHQGLCAPGHTSTPRSPGVWFHSSSVSSKVHRLSPSSCASQILRDSPYDPSFIQDKPSGQASSPQSDATHSSHSWVDSKPSFLLSPFQPSRWAPALPSHQAFYSPVHKAAGA